VVVGYGPKGTCPTGRLPVFSVETEEEAEALIQLACSTNYEGEYIAKELAEEQTMENLQAFSDRLADIHERFFAPRCPAKSISPDE